MSEESAALSSYVMTRTDGMTSPWITNLRQAHDSKGVWIITAPGNDRAHATIALFSNAMCIALFLTSTLNKKTYVYIIAQ